MATIRSCTHAGSWYSRNASELSKQLDNWLGETKSIGENTRAIIVPHAGYSYSGRAASRGYINLDASKYKRIFILGPSHHVYMKTCGLTKLTHFETPIGNLEVDTEVIKKLDDTSIFTWTTKDVDEDEHSIELHLPYVAKMIQDKKIKIVPIMVGSLSKDTEEQYGKVLAPYFDDPENFFVISSDFCHWGKRFGYTHYNQSAGPIHKSIEELDRTGMSMIETGDPLQFSTYLKETKNTICGRNPIAVMLWTAKNSRNKHSIKSLHYEQSSQCMNMNDSSVSYGVLAIKQD
ncbi:hypothetical protein PPL_08986 [Heterostelium album PN500]|uniref:Protein MEMO1 n=1 Tax=Heterostelium pallidum (strain ATCC 26659 / Pp 5 / PN500) TaxID=670386 RepID=D3BKA5_HETP5|nr:hypothetical protein PPL_08986 [Heterostelium album PN500]EFA78335.1 hypothetical protein PPL_08986 [Heterostelium album PN500]|eukprot:XP_020430460.1 hypothetical protein PPL_08986 [Heterostelium album PN500]